MSPIVEPQFLNSQELRFFDSYNPGTYRWYMRYGERLKEARSRLGWSQGKLAEEINNVCTQENISKIERSKTATGSEFTYQFAKALKVRIEWLAEEAGEMNLHETPGELNEPMRHILSRMSTLTEKEQYQVVRLVDAFAEPSSNDPDHPTSAFGGQSASDS